MAQSRHIKSNRRAVGGTNGASPYRLSPYSRLFCKGCSKMITKKEGFVAMIDILGFSEQVLSYPDETKLQEYSDAVMKAVEPFGANVIPILFSDTVVLYTLSNDDEDFDRITLVCSRLMYLLISHEIPLRGAIAHGAFVRSQDQG